MTLVRPVRVITDSQVVITSSAHYLLEDPKERADELAREVNRLFDILRDARHLKAFAECAVEEQCPHCGHKWEPVQEADSTPEWYCAWCGNDLEVDDGKAEA